MKRNFFLIIVVVCSVCCLVGAYYFWYEAKKMINVEKNDTLYNITKIQKYSFYEDLLLKGNIASIESHEYTIDLDVFTIRKNIVVGSNVVEGDVIADSISQTKEKMKTDITGTITSIRKQNDEQVRVVIENIDMLKVCFYVPQQYCSLYEIGTKINVYYNHNEYSSVISNKDYHMTEKEEIDSTDNIITKKYQYMEATLNQTDGLVINGDVELREKVLVSENCKAIKKDAINYKGDKPYVLIINEVGEKREVYVEIGKSDDDMVEIISDEIYVGDQVVIE